MSDTLSRVNRVTAHEYLASGYDPFSVDELLNLHGSLTRKEQPHIERRAASLWIAAEICIDLAMQTDETEAWIQEADSLLDRLITKCHDLRDAGDEIHYRNNSQTLISAYTRKSELPNWGRALRGDDVVDHYEQAMEAGQLITSIGNSENKHTKGKVVEYVFVLLGARAQHVGMTEKWYGRTAVQLEDAGKRNVDEINSNWDIGISSTANSESYINPELKIQVTTNPKRKKKSNYLLAGIPILSGKTFDCDNPNAVIAGCLEEIGIGTPAHTDIEPYSTNRLDDITGNLYSKFVELHTEAIKVIS